MSGDTGTYYTPTPSNKRVNVEVDELVGALGSYPHKSFKAGNNIETESIITPFQQRLKDVFSTPSTGRTLTPCTPKLSGKRDLVHRLRQQLKNRDEMIMQMQNQILDQGRALHGHELRIGDLEALLQEKNRSLFVAEQKIDHLRKVAAESCTCRPGSCQFQGPVSSRIDSRATAARRHQDLEHIKLLVSEARKLTEELKLHGREKQLWQRGLCSEYKMKVHRLHMLEKELAEARAMALKNESLFEACEKERAVLSGTLTGLQQKLENEAIKLEQMRVHRNTSAAAGTASAKGEQSENTVGGSAPVFSSSSYSSRKLGNSADSSKACNNYAQIEQGSRSTYIERLLVSLQHQLECLLSEVSSYANSRIGNNAIQDHMSELTRYQQMIETVKHKACSLYDEFSNLLTTSAGKAEQRKESRRDDRYRVSEWSYGAEDVAQLSMDMEQVMIDDKSLGSPRGSTDEPAVVGTGTSVGDTKGSFGRFVFDMNQDSDALLVSQTQGSSNMVVDGTSCTSHPSSLSPFSKMMAKLDLLHQSPSASVTDSLIVVEKVERSIGSLDSAFDRILDNTLDDMVRICSPSRTFDVE